jgi:hypothetical protein
VTAHLTAFNASRPATLRRVPMGQRYQRATCAMPVCHSHKNRERFFGMPNGSHGLPPRRPQSVCNFALAGDAYSVSSRTVRSPQVAPWLSAGPSSDNVSPIRRLTRKLRRRFIPIVIVLAVIVSAIIASTIIVSVRRTPRHRDSGVTGAIHKAFGPRVAAESDIPAKLAESLARCFAAMVRDAVLPDRSSP